MITLRWPNESVKFPCVEFRRLFRQIKRTVPSNAEMVTAYTDGAVTLRSNRRLDGYHEAADMSGMQGVQVGDFVVHGLDILRGSVGVSDSEGAMSSVCVVCEPIVQIEPRYFAWLIRAQAASGLPRALARGVREGGADFRRWDTLAELPVLHPPLPVQRAIADYLDTETARLDALIEKKQRMIELLLLRQAELERSVVIGTTSFSTNALAPTGNQLIPMLPSTWRLVRARFLCSIETGSSDTDESSTNGSYPFFVRSQTPQLSDRFIFDTEAILTAGDGAGVGKVFHHFRGKFDAHQRVYVMHQFREVEPRFFFYCFSAYFALAALDGSAKSTVDSVRRHMITEFPVPVPPREEQVRLVKVLDTSRIRTERLVELLTNELELLREHRQTLITAAVTGELDVPEVAA